MKKEYDVEYETLETGYMVTCIYCEKQFFASRFGATFCSSRCRTAQHRKLKETDKDIEKLHKLIDKLIEKCPRKGVGKIASNLELARNRIDYLLENIESDIEDINHDKFSHDNVHAPKFRPLKKK